MRMKCNVGVGCGRSENCILCKITRFLSTRVLKNRMLSFYDQTQRVNFSGQLIYLMRRSENKCTGYSTFFRNTMH